MNQTSHLDGYFQERSPESGHLEEQPLPTASPAETLEQKRRREADKIMRSQWSKIKHTRQVELQHNLGQPLRIHACPRPTGKQIKKARAAARRAKLQDSP